MDAQEHTFTLEDMQIWRQQLIRNVLRAVVVIGLPVVIVGSYDAYVSQIPWVIPLYLIAYATATLVTFLRRASLALQAGVLLGVIYTVGTIELVSAGLVGDAMLFLLTLPFLAVIFFGRRGGVGALIVVILTLAVLGWAFSTGCLIVPVEKLASSASLVRWLTSITTFLMVGILLVNSQAHLLLRLTDALARSRRLAHEGGQRATTEQEQREQLQAVVAKYMVFVASVARGNLTARLTWNDDGPQDDLFTVLGRNLNEMAGNLRDMTVRTRDTAQRLSSAAAEILATTAQQASGANEQSAAISQTTTTVNELKTIAGQSVARAQEVADASRRAVEVSRAGQQVVHDTIWGMAQIRTRVEGIAENILALSEQTLQIGEIIATVNGIACGD